MSIFLSLLPSDLHLWAERTLPMETLGEYLRRERKLRDISLEEICAKTRIQMKILQALEENRYGELPHEVYIRGFLKAYARYLGLDENEVLLRYEGEVVGLVNQRKGSHGEGILSWWRRKRRILIILLCIALTIAWILWLHPTPKGYP